MFITKKAISRRTVLRGFGAAVALPLLDAMMPAFASVPAPVRRLGVVYHPNGVIYDQWLPTGVGSDFQTVAHACGIAAVSRQIDCGHRSGQRSGRGAGRRRRRPLARWRNLSHRRAREEDR